MTIEDLLGLMIPTTYVVLLVVEALARGRRFPVVRLWRARGALFVAILLGINATAPSWLPVEWLAAHRLLDGSRLGTAGGAIVAYLGVSLAQYAFHRAEHRFQGLWRVFHQLHHSAIRMDLSGSAYTHPLEVVVSAAIFTVVTTFVFGLTPLAIAIAGYVGAFYSMFQHLDVRTPRWLGYLIERPESHCIHHRRDYHRSNYSDLPLWDIVFGTFENPETFEGEVGFEPSRARQIGAMLLGADVHDASRPLGRGEMEITASRGDRRLQA